MNKMKINKDSIKTSAIVFLILIIIILVGVFFIPSYNNDIYSIGFIEGQINVAQTQTQTGNIFLVNNGTVQSFPLNDLCEALDRI